MGSTELPREADLAVRDVRVAFGGVTALESASLEVSSGEVLGIIGPNGAGKTTLFNVICGFVRPDGGILTWRGQSLARVRPHQLAELGIARTLQGVGLFANLSVLENVMVGAQRFRHAGWLSAALALPRSDRDERALRDRARAALEQVGCWEYADRLPGTLPFALQKGVALARALVCEPDLLLLDEPAGGLGAEDVERLTEMIRELGGSIAVMLVEHHMDLVMAVCDRVVVLDFGRVIASGEPEEIKRSPAVAEAYLGRAAESSELPGAGKVSEGA